MEAMQLVVIEAFGYEHEISSGETPDVLFTAEEVEEFYTSKYVYILSGYDSEIEHVLDIFDLNATWTEAGECLIFSSEELASDVLDECKDCFIAVDVETRG